MAIKVPFMRTPFNYDADAASRDSGLKCEDESRAQQSFKDECDINVIVKRFGITGGMPESVSTPVFADFSDLANDYHSAVNLVMQADEAFMTIPAEVRTFFANDPGNFVAFCSDPNNAEKMRELGLTNTPISSSVAVGNVAASGEVNDGKV